MARELSKGDEALVRLAMGKQLAGARLSAEESRALRRWERHDRESRAWEVYAAIPKRHYCEMAGRQVKVVNQQGERYGLKALLSPVIDLRVLLRQFHDFLAANWMRFEQDIEEAAILSGGSGNSPNMERYRGYKADLAALEVEEKRGDLIPRADARAGMLIVVSRLRAATEQLEREFGIEARAVIDDALDQAAVDIEERFSLGQVA